MRCKYCDAVLEPYEYEWNEELGQWEESSSHWRGNCVASESDDPLDALLEDVTDEQLR